VLFHELAHVDADKGGLIVEEELGQRLAQRGHRVSVFRFQSGFAPRRVGFENGVWRHEGGTWRIDHREAGLLLIRRKLRTDAEIARVAHRRKFHIVLAPASMGRTADLVVPNLPPLTLSPVSDRCAPDAVLSRLLADLGTPPPKSGSSASKNMALCT
jgi:hypothetical protein